MKVKSSLPIIVTIVAVVCLAGAVAYNSSQMDAKKEKAAASAKTQAKPQKNSTLAPTAVVVEVQPSSYKASIKGYGEAVPRYAITYSAEVSGRVKKLMPRFETGNIVKMGQTLALLENTTYQQAVAEAKSNLASAKLDLLEEQRTGEQALLEWKRSGLTGEPNSPLVLRAPQLAAQKAVVENAEFTLKKAQQDLAKTEINAPFDALIVSQNIQPGSYVQTGGSIAQLYSTDRVEIEIPLSAKQWQNLPSITNNTLAQSSAKKIPVLLNSADSDRNWAGYVARIEQNVDTTSRQRSLIVAVDHPFDKNVELYPGTFVQAEIEGKQLDNTWQLPASAISQQGEMWFVDDDGKLNKIMANKLFEKGNFVYVTPIENMPSAQIIKRPLSSYIVGMRVVPKIEG
jgi:RND family efflux transporter MFP subunit